MSSSVSQCLQNPPTLNPACGSGIVDEIAGLKAYVSGAANSNRAILLISDVFGYEAPNLRKLADKVAGEGFLVVVPDFLYGDPVNFDKPGFDIKAWLEMHGTDKGCEDAKSVISSLRSQGKSYIGVAGFCWGGVVAAKLAKSDVIQAAVSLHPGLISIEDINEIKIPIAFLGAEVDHICSAEELKRYGEILSAKPGIDSYVKIYPGVSHGFAVRYNLEDDSAVKSAEEAHSDMMSWFTKYIK
ncbi:hypothetical protein V2J09_023159 [Rumex salicifolius]